MASLAAIAAASAHGILGVPASADEALVRRCVHHSRFKQMKEQAKGWSFFRKGVVGDAERHFTPELATQFDGVIASQSRGAGIPYAQCE